ncbi:6245_t:CDS:2, partial [Dentiscutata erythropus]
RYIPIKQTTKSKPSLKQLIEEVDQIKHNLNFVESPQTVIPYSIETPSESPVEEYYSGIERLEEEFQKFDKERLQLIEESREVKVAEDQERMANQILFKPKIFYGDEKEDPVEWMSEFKKAARINRWETDAQKRNAMEIYLKEDAEEWWLELMDKICKRIDDLTPERKAEYFLRGLTPELASLALTHEKETVEDIVNLIEKYEEGRDITNRVEPKIKKRKEKRYETETESESESEEEVKRKIKKDYTKEKLKKKEEEKTKPENDIEEESRCFNCEKLGHISRDYDDDLKDKVTKKLIEILVGKYGRDSDSDEDFQTKKLRTDNIIKTTYTLMEIQPTETLKTFEIKSTKNNKKKMKPIAWKKSETVVKKNKKEVPLLLREPEFDIKKKLLEALRKPKEFDVKLVSQNLIPKTTVLECQVEVDGNNISAIIDSGVATSIVTRDTIEQLGYELEKASNCEIITATGERSKSLEKIRDFPITINEKQIPMDIEVMEIDFYHLLLGNN